MASQNIESLTVSGHNHSATRQPKNAMHEHNAIVAQRFVDELACSGKVYEEIGVIDILDGNAQVPVAGGRVICGDGLGTKGKYVGDTPV